MVSPPQALDSGLLPPNPPLLFGASAIAAAVTVAAARQLFQTSRAEAEQLLQEASQEMDHAHRALLPAEAELRARAESALTLAQAAEAQAKLGKPVPKSTLLQLESSIIGVTAGLQQRQAAAAAAGSTGAAVQGRPGAPAWTFGEQPSAVARQAPVLSGPQPPADVLAGSAPALEPAEHEAGGSDSSRVLQIMGRVQNILAELNRHEQNHVLAQQQQQQQEQEQQHKRSTQRPASMAAGTPPAEAAKTAREQSTGRASPPPSPLPPSRTLREPTPAAPAQPSASQPLDAGWVSSPSAAAAPAAPLLAPAPAASAPPLGRAAPFPAPPSPWDAGSGPAPAPSKGPSGDTKEQAAKGPEGLRDLSLTRLKCSLMDVVYGTARGVNASLNQRGQVEELVYMLEARNPNRMAKDALGTLHGRWKLVYTTHAPTLLLLKAIQSVPLVDIGDVYQLVDGATLTAHNKIDLALPVAMSLRADSGMEPRSPHSFQVRFQRVGLDTFIQTPQLLVSLDVPDGITVLGHTIDLRPLRRYLVEPVQSGVNQAQELLRRAASPDLELPALESNSLWMMTTYLDDTLRISRDDAGATFVMLRDA